jgi:hypothetical protein
MSQPISQPIPLYPVAAPRAPGAWRANRLEVNPPALWTDPEPAWRQIRRWVAQLRRRGSSAPETAPAAAPGDRLSGARADFGAALADVPGTASADLQTRVRHARSLRELWHLRTELYSLVARVHMQAEAERRLDRLNAHFPTRTPRIDAIDPS